MRGAATISAALRPSSQLRTPPNTFEMIVLPPGEPVISRRRSVSTKVG